LEADDGGTGASVGSMESEGRARAAARPRSSGPEGEAWIARLRSQGAVRDEAIAELHELLLRAARFEIGRRRATLPHLRGGDFDDIALESANDALMAVLGKLDDFRGESRFTTWAYKFALFEAAAKLRRRAWQGREVPLEPESWSFFDDRSSSPEEEAEREELLATIRRGIDDSLTERQRAALVAVAINGVPIDVVADRLGASRGAVYKTLHDARRKLRARLERAGLALNSIGGRGHEDA
jgi:RNA polymerase sigma-70 factor, ECF subfamily